MRVHGDYLFGSGKESIFLECINIAGVGTLRGQLTLRLCLRDVMIMTSTVPKIVSFRWIKRWIMVLDLGFGHSLAA